MSKVINRMTVDAAPGRCDLQPWSVPVGRSERLCVSDHDDTSGTWGEHARACPEQDRTDPDILRSRLRRDATPPVTPPPRQRP